MKKADLLKWAKVASGPLPVVTEKKKKPIRLIDLPGVRTLEDRLLLADRDRARHEDMVAHVSRDLFGVCHFDLQFKTPAEYQDLPSTAVEKYNKLNQLWLLHEEQFETSDDLTDDETVEVMAELGFDFRDDRGQPLRCAKFMSRPAEAASKGITGRLPDMGAVEVKRFESALEKARDAFLAKRRKS